MLADEKSDGYPSLRCEPALTRAVDAIPYRINRARATRIARHWSKVELSLWRGLPIGVAAAGKITPEYILATQRTRKHRDTSEIVPVLPGNRKLSDAEVWEIWETNETEQVLANRYNVCVRTIRRMKLIAASWVASGEAA